MNKKQDLVGLLYFVLLANTSTYDLPKTFPYSKNSKAETIG